MVPDNRGNSTRDVSTRRPILFRDVISHSRSGRKSHSSAPKTTQCRRLLVGSGGQRRRSHGNCGAMLPLEAAVWSTARQQRNGTQSDPLAGQRRGSLRSTRHCEPMWRSGWLAPSSLRAGHLCPAQRCPGKVVDMGGGRTAGGQMPGAQNRSPAGSRSTFRTMRPCASAMKQSIKRCSFKDEARCGAS